MSFTVFPETKRIQALASDPSRSVFVSANAGSGKTHVLTERVVRLLLSGSPASKILCLTYTKAAAAEMSNRVFERLGRWATASRETLVDELERLDEARPDEKRIAQARRLFAEALESPGGLKIQTIHAFCEAVLHRFPLEANVPGHFDVLDESMAALLRAEARRRLVTVAASGAGERAREGLLFLGEAFAEVLSLGGEFGLEGLIDEIVASRDAIRRHVESAGGLEGAVALLAEGLRLSPQDDEAAVLATLDDVPGFDRDFTARLLEAARASPKATDAKLVEKLEAFRSAKEPPARYEALRALCLTKAGTPYKVASVATKGVTDVVADLAERLEQATEALVAAEDRLAALRLFRASRAALVIADELERDYAVLKRRRGVLDFEDLIVKTADLLSRSEASAWVHYKLDQGIDHVLIDEAQDTSPRQWEVMRQLVEEFFAGEGQSRRRRTVFAVGDEKQSIYSFQGASPRQFAEERRAMERRAADAQEDFASVRLTQSFRTAADVLAAIDRVFETGAGAGLTSEGDVPVHQTARAGAPGLVEVWPAFEASGVEASRDWLKPLDHQPENAPANRLARRIAERIESWLGDAIEHKGRTRPLSPGDVIVLVRKRSGFVEAMARALRERAIPVAGADRLVLTDHIAVQDLVALGRTVANFEDDLSLAAALKSPLFGFSDDELMALALSRSKDEAHEHLSLALRRLAGPQGPARIPAYYPDRHAAALLEKARHAIERLDTLRSRTGFETVFGFYARLLGPEGGRALLTARLGQDAGEVIDAFLDRALAEEEAGRTGLDTFLADLEAAPPQVKREMDHGRGEVRIMTAHASKGLEAPVIFLVDPGSAPFSHIHGARLIPWVTMPNLRPGLTPGFLWRASKELETSAVEELKSREKALAEDEYRRLLYVGMTRAADRLVVCGLAGTRGPREDTWLSLVSAALAGACETETDADGAVKAWRFGGAESAKARKAAVVEPPPPRAIDLSPLPPEPPVPRPLTPSAAGGMDIDAGEPQAPARSEGEAATSYVSPVLGEAAASPSLAIRRGLVVHRLLQVLPDIAPDERESAAGHYVSLAAAEMSERDQGRLVETACGVLSDTRFAEVFAPGSRAEVSVAGEIELSGRSYLVNGTIDRLAVSATRVLIVDYKTNRPPPPTLETVPEAYVVQLALYRALLAPLYPDRTVEAVLLFTEGPHFVSVPAERMDEALAKRVGARRKPEDAETGDPPL